MKIDDCGLRVEVEAEAWERIRQWAQLAGGEFSCLGVVDDDFYLSEVHLLDQECSDSSTELDPRAVAELLMGIDRPEQMRAWIHSHGELNVFWSATDHECIEGMANESFLVSIVVNKRGDYRCRIDLFEPMRLIIDEVPVVVRVRDPRLEAQCKKEFEQKVREVPITFSVTSLGQEALADLDSDLIGGFGKWARLGVGGGGR